MRKITTTIVIILTVVSSFAQNIDKAKTILDNAVNKIKSYSVVEVIFDLTLENREEKIRESHSGKAYIKENMYRVEVMDVINYFDGECLYSYMPDVEEVNIKFPEEDQEEMLDPTIIFDIHNRKFNRELIEDKNGKVYIELTPKEEHKQIYRIGVWIDSNKNIIEKVTSFGKDGNDVIIAIKSLKEPAFIPDKSFFKFDSEAHPDVEIIDLR